MKHVSASAIKWTRPEQFHLTLRFLGSIERAVLSELSAKLRQTCAALCPLDLKCAGLGLFPERGRPRVLWAGITDAREQFLKRTFKAIAEATIGVGQQEEGGDKHFSGHITLARCKEIGRTGADELRRRVRDFAQRQFGSWKATEVLVMQSQLSPKGARYSALEGIPLGRNQPCGIS